MGLIFESWETSFNVSAYQEEVVATLVEGKVQLKKGNEQVILSPNQQAIWSDDEFRVKQVMPVIMCYGKRDFLF